MTLAEVKRRVESFRRVKLNDMKQQAQFDYILADAIGRSVARIYGGGAKYPSLYEMYPTLFSDEEYKRQEEERINELSAIRFKQFADNYNKRFKGGKINE